MTYEEFKKKLVFKKDKIYIECLSFSIDKTQFLTETSYDIDAQNKYIEELYYDNLEQLSKQ